MATEAAILVCSCDKYEDVWPVFFALFFKYWPECSFPIFLMSNGKHYVDRRVKTVVTPNNVDWSSSFRNALMQINTDNILVIMEDYLLDRFVDHVNVLRLISVMNRLEAVCMHLFPDPFPNIAVNDDKDFGYVQAHQPFRVNLQAAVWDRKALIELVQPGESAWDFEVEATKRSIGYKRPFLSVMCPEEHAPFHYYRTGVVRGKWMPGALRLCKREGIEINLGFRKIGWVRGFVRDNKLFKPLRFLFVAAKRRFGAN